MMATATIVAGLGFGDEGKGTTVDFLVRKHKSKLVVRYNGGAQAGHNVVTEDGCHHCFSQWGSGTFAGAKTYLSRYMLLNPIFALSEAKHLERRGVTDPLSLLLMEEGAFVTTPFHVAANRLRELSRAFSSGGVHGSCGMGIGETVQDGLSQAEDRIQAWMLVDRHILRTRLKQCQERKRAELADLPLDRTNEKTIIEQEILSDPKVVDETVEAYVAFANNVPVRSTAWLQSEMAQGKTGHVIFEGAQGVLLDQDWGFHPHTTWSDCTFGNALDLIHGDRRMGAQWSGGKVKRLGVLRVYHTRHGEGPFPSADPALDELSKDDHNVRRLSWQGSFRSGVFDLVLAQYALDVVGGCDGLVMTHLDKLYDKESIAVCNGHEAADGRVTRVIRPTRQPLPPMSARTVPVDAPDLDHQEALGRRLKGSKAVLTQMPLGGLGSALAGPAGALRHAMRLGWMLGTPVALVSSGATASRKTWTDGLSVDDIEGLAAH